MDNVSFKQVQISPLKTRASIFRHGAMLGAIKRMAVYVERNAAKIRSSVEMGSVYGVPIMIFMKEK